VVGAGEPSRRPDVEAGEPEGVEQLVGGEVPGGAMVGDARACARLPAGSAACEASSILTGPGISRATRSGDGPAADSTATPTTRESWRVPRKWWSGRVKVYPVQTTQADH
jgi:hypothetical protein